MEELTARQARVLRFVEEHIARHGFAPSVREVAAAMRIGTPKGAADHLKALERKGYLERSRGRSRALRVTRDSSGARPGIPIVGRIAAGAPILAEEHIEGSLAVAADAFGRISGELFALRVIGDSMIGDHIVDGDLAILRAQPRVENGEIAAVLIEGDATLKRLHRRGERVELRPSNPAHKTIALDGGEVRVLGRLVGVLRR